MYKNKKILAVIPARGGSKGVPSKNIYSLAGKPLIAYTIECALKSKLIDKVIISTDDEKIASVAKKYKAEVPFLRPKKLAGDKSPMVPVVQHAIKYLEDKENEKYDYIILLQPPAPLKTVKDIDESLKLLINTSANNVYSMTLLHEITYHPLRIKKLLKGNKVKAYIKSEIDGIQRQALPKVYRRNGAIFAFTYDLIMNKDQIIGDDNCDTRAYIMPSERSVDTDSIYEMWLAEIIIKNNK